MDMSCKEVGLMVCFCRLLVETGKADDLRPSEKRTIQKATKAHEEIIDKNFIENWAHRSLPF